MQKTIYTEKILKLKFASNEKEELRLREGETTRHNLVIQELDALKKEMGISKFVMWFYLFN